MQSRNHPFNQSQRPLLERRQFVQPQVVKSSLSSSTSSSAASSTIATRGFDDFSMVRQYENLNHITGRGYPYGEIDGESFRRGDPYNFNVRDDDFVFSDHNNGLHSDDDDYEDVRVYQKNQINNSHKYTTPAPPPPVKRVLPVRPVSPFTSAKDDGPFVFGMHTQNSFTPTYDKAAKLYQKDELQTSPNSSQVGNFCEFYSHFYYGFMENNNIMLLSLSLALLPVLYSVCGAGV
jgi:hypothetical protein